MSTFYLKQTGFLQIMTFILKKEKEKKKEKPHMFSSENRPVGSSTKWSRQVGRPPTRLEGAPLLSADATALFALVAH